MKVAFFGMGAMGLPMAKNLLKAGYSVYTAVHRSAAFVEQLNEFEAFTLCESPSQAAQGADVIITILPADAQIKAFLMDEAFAQAVKPGSVIIEMSSCMTQTVQEVEKYYQKRNVFVVDAPVSGGTAGAEKGTLTIFASGEQKALEVADPLFQAMGKTIFKLGPCGEGKTFKNLNNLLLTVNVAVVSEVFRIAEQLHLDMDLFYDVICSSSGTSAAFEKRWKKMTGQAFDGGFKLGLGRKDLGNALALAGSTPVPLSHLAYELMLANAKYDEQELAAMCKLFEN